MANSIKPGTVKIITINTVIDARDIVKIYGLGDDGNVYVWSQKEGAYYWRGPTIL